MKQDRIFVQVFEFVVAETHRYIVITTSPAKSIFRAAMIAINTVGRLIIDRFIIGSSQFCRVARSKRPEQKTKAAKYFLVAGVLNPSIRVTAPRPEKMRIIGTAVATYLGCA